MTKINLTEKEVSRIYGIPEGTQRNWRYQGKGPRYYRVGRRIYYKKDDIEAFLFSRPVLTKDSVYLE